MKTDTLVLAVLLAAGADAAPSELGEEVVARGPRPGDKTVITNTVAHPPEAAVLEKTASVMLGPPTARRAVPVELISRRHTFLRRSPTGTILPGSQDCYEFEIRSVEPGRFGWRCWVGPWPTPHGFRVLTTESGASYACYIKDGVHLFHLSERSPTAAMPRGPRENPSFDSEHPDALPILGMQQLREALGRAALLHRDPTTMDAEVLALSDGQGELRVTVRGREPRRGDYHDDRLLPGMRERWLRSRATFALRGGRWELVSATPQ